MEYSVTQKGNRVLIYRGYEYTKYRENEGGVITWRCRVYFSTKCRAFLRSQEDNIIGEVPQHCHDSKPQVAQANIIMAKMKQNMKEVGATPRNVLGHALTNVNCDVLGHLPKQSSITRSLFNHKKTAHIPNPTTTNFLIPENWSDLILHDTGEDDQERILVIGKGELLEEG